MENKSYYYKYPRPSVTTDCVLFCQDNGSWKVLLIERGGEPFKGRWAFPGGFLEENEAAEDGAKRELQEETGLTGIRLRQLHTLTTPGRDPRGWTISIAYWAVLPGPGETGLRGYEVHGADDAARAEWFNVADVPPLAFDHDELLRMALQELRQEYGAPPAECGRKCAAIGRAAFESVLTSLSDVVGNVRLSAHRLHASVNQTYDGALPYGFHLDMVADVAREYGHLVCADERDVLPLMFGAYYHDSIEDARLTYNDVMAVARQYMDEEQARMATEIAYALTNDKGRNRAERAGENYYQGIRQTPYAPFVKLADRWANMRYSFGHANKSNAHMKEVYGRELPHFLESIASPYAGFDVRFLLPKEMISALKQQC